MDGVDELAPLRRLRLFPAAKAAPSERVLSADMNDDSNQTFGAGDEIFQHWARLCDHNNPITGEK